MSDENEDKGEGDVVQGDKVEGDKVEGDSGDGDSSSEDGSPTAARADEQKEQAREVADRLQEKG